LLFGCVLTTFLLFLAGGVVHLKKKNCLGRDMKFPQRNNND